MEAILDGLRENGIDMRTLSHHVKYLFEHHGALYSQMVLNVNAIETRIN
jgi:hypothetical protein